MSKKVMALIPAYNEENYVYKTVRAVLAIPEVSEVLVIDDGSADYTAIRARQAGAKVLVLPCNRGKGEALNRGIAMVGMAEVVLFLDADLGGTATEARQLLLPVLAGEADMTIARFPKSTRKGGFGLVKLLAREGIRRYTGLVMESPLSGQRAMTRQVLEKVIPFAPGFGVEVGLTIAVARMGFLIMEVPVQMSHKESGRNWQGFLHRGRQFWDVAKVLARAWQNGR